MTDQQIMTNLLHLLKGVSTLHLWGSIESATPEVNQVFKKTLTDNLSLQMEVFKAMEARGWYKMTAEKNSAIDKVVKKYQSG